MELSFLAKELEIGNAHDPFAFAIKKVTPTGNVTVGKSNFISLFGFYSSRCMGL